MCCVVLCCVVLWCGVGGDFGPHRLCETGWLASTIMSEVVGGIWERFERVWKGMEGYLQGVHGRTLPYPSIPFQTLSFGLLSCTVEPQCSARDLVTEKKRTLLLSAILFFLKTCVTPWHPWIWLGGPQQPNTNTFIGCWWR